MKIDYITQPNVKGQIVLPKVLRDDLGITADSYLSIKGTGDGIYITPIKSVVTQTSTEDSYQAILDMTKGSWGSETKEEREKSKLQKKKRIEEALKRRNT